VTETRSRGLMATLILGVVGGIALIVTDVYSKFGPLGLLTYAIILLAIVVYLRGGRVDTFRRRFTISLGSFMLATVIFYGYILLVENRNALESGIWPNMWPLLLVAAVGTILSAAIAALTRVRTIGAG